MPNISAVPVRTYTISYETEMEVAFRTRTSISCPIATSNRHSELPWSWCTTGRASAIGAEKVA